MEIAVNMSSLRGCGTTNVGMHILHEISNLETRHNFEIWVPEIWPVNTNELRAGILIHRVPAGIRSKVILDNVIIPRQIRDRKIDCLFSVGDTGTMNCVIPHLVMVQQSYLACLDKCDFYLPPIFKFKMKIMGWYFKAGLGNVSMITVQTNFMKKELIRRWNISDEQIRVIPSAVDIDKSQTVNQKGASIDEEYICYVASALPHKNHILLPDIMKCLCDNNKKVRCKLTVSEHEVPDMVAYAKRLGVLDCFDFLGYVTHEEAIKLMKGSLALVMPSKLESFGLPYYEALGVGCPVVVSDRAFAREACEDFAFYADPNQGHSFAKHIIYLIENTDMRRKIKTEAPSYISRKGHLWKNITREYISLLEDLVQKNKRNKKS